MEDLLQRDIQTRVPALYRKSQDYCCLLEYANCVTICDRALFHHFNIKSVNVVGCGRYNTELIQQQQKKEKKKKKGKKKEKC